MRRQRGCNPDGNAAPVLCQITLFALIVIYGFRLSENEAMPHAEDADLPGIRIKSNLRFMQDIEVRIDQRLAFRSVRDLVRACFIVREIEEIAGRYGAFPLGSFEQARAAEYEEHFLIAQVIVIGNG